MTRNRADENGQVPPLMATYYRQRATAGLIVTESTTVTPQAVGYPFRDPQRRPGGKLATPGRRGARTGGAHLRTAVALRPDLPPEPAARRDPDRTLRVALRRQAVTYAGPQDFAVLRELALDEIRGVVAQFRHAAERARQAGFDGVEVHAGIGCLIDQFLRDGADLYGGSPRGPHAPAGRGPGRGVRRRAHPARRRTPDPGEQLQLDVSDTASQAHFECDLHRLSPRGLAYAHVLEGDMIARTRTLDHGALRAAFTGVHIANNGYDLARAQEAVPPTSSPSAHPSWPTRTCP